MRAGPLPLLCAALTMNAMAAVPGVDPASEPFPITLSATPRALFIGSNVTLSGSSVGAPTTEAVHLVVHPPGGTPLAAINLSAPIQPDGSYSVPFSPKVSGVYEVESLAADMRGRADASFRVESASTVGPDTSQVLDQVIADATLVLTIVQQKLESVPASPARDDAAKQLAAITQTIQTLRAPANTIGADLANLIGAPPPTHSNLDLATARDELLGALDAAQQSHQRSVEEESRIRQAEITCDNLEVASEGIKWASVLMNFLDGTFKGAALNFLQDFLGAATESGINASGAGGGSGPNAFVAGEAAKNYDLIATRTVQNTKTFDLNIVGAVSLLTDLVGKGVEIVMQSYCVQFTGPVRAHMHAEFYKNFDKWWEYSFDVNARVTLHYPKHASGGSVPLKGRIEGFALNFTVSENALTVLYPRLMTGTVQKRIPILPLAETDTTAKAANFAYATEGSVFGGLRALNSFFFEVTGTATDSTLTIEIGPSRKDMDAKARILAIYLPVLSLLPNVTLYSLPYKPAHFVFERASNSYLVPLKTQGKVIVGKQHFESKRDDGPAQGEYSVEIEACNPGC